MCLIIMLMVAMEMVAMETTMATRVVATVLTVAGVGPIMGEEKGIIMVVAVVIESVID